MKYVAVASSMAIRLRANVVYDHYERANITMLGLVKQAMEELHKALVVGVERNVTVDELGCGGSHVPLAVEHVIQMPDEPRIRYCLIMACAFPKS
jgi:hypothetical protein